MDEERAVSEYEQAIIPEITMPRIGGIFLNPCAVLVDGHPCGLPFQGDDGWLLDHHGHTYHPFPVESKPRVPGYYKRTEIIEGEFVEADRLLNEGNR